MRHLLYISALAVLLCAACATPSEHRRMAAALAEADSMNRHYVPFTTDSVLLRVTEFYDRHGTDSDRIRAHYLLGCAYRDLGEAPQALAAYQDAIDLADTTRTDCNYLLLSKVCGQMAKLFHDQNLPYDELKARKLCQQFALLCGDSLLYIRSCEMMIKPYKLIGATARMQYYIEEVSNMYLKQGRPDLSISLKGLYIYPLIEAGKLDSAYSLINEYEKKSGLFDNEGNIAKGREVYNYFKGYYYLKKHQIDSADYYMRRILPYGKPTDAYRGLLAVFEQRKNVDSIIKYARLYEDAVDTMNNQRRTEAVRQMADLYNYQRYQRLADAAKVEVANARTAYVVMVAAFLLICLLYWRIQRKKAEMLRQYRANIVMLEKSQEELSQLHTHEEEYQNLIEEKKGQIKLLEQKIHKYQLGRKTKASKFLQSDIYAKFHALADTGRTPSKEEWQQLRISIIDLLPEFHELMTAYKYVLNPTEYKTCLLVRLHINPQAISNMLNVKAPYISRIRKEMLSTMFDIEGKASDFDEKLQAIN